METCPVCNNEVEELVEDYIIPYNEGGEKNRSNTRLVCKNCKRYHRGSKHSWEIKRRMSEGMKSFFQGYERKKG